MLVIQIEEVFEAVPDYFDNNCLVERLYITGTSRSIEEAALYVSYSWFKVGYTKTLPYPTTCKGLGNRLPGNEL